MQRIVATRLADLAHMFTGEPDEPCEICEKSETDAVHQLGTRELASHRSTFTRERGI